MNEFLIFWIAATIGAIAVFPYQLKMLKSKIARGEIKNTKKKLPPTPVLILLSFIQSVIILGLASFIGTLLAPKVDLHWWLLDNLLNGVEIPYSVSAVLIIAVVIGFVSALLIILLDVLFSKKMPKYDNQEQPTRGQSFLASFYGGISEEVLLRLFVMTLLVSFFSFLKLGDISYWLGILIAAILFGIGHLPAAFSMIGKTRVVAIRTILLNAIPGVLFGYLYWKYGIEIAMVSHFSADIFLHVVFGPIFRKKMQSKNTSLAQNQEI